MKLSIIICTYNRAEKLRVAVQSMLDAEIPENNLVQLTIVNNNSTDGTEAIIREFSKKLSMIKITYLFEKKQGKSHALNKALEYVSGDIIAFTDDDVTVDRNWIKEMIKAFDRNPNYNCFGGKMIAEYPKKLPEWLAIEGSMRFLRSVYFNRDDGELETEYGNGTISKIPGGGNMFFRNEAIQKNSFFRTDLGPKGKELGFSEDTEYCHRLLEKGEKFMYIPSAIVYHPVYIERLNKKYLLNWQYKCGRSEVRRNGGYKDIAKAFGIPRYLFRKFISHSVGWGLSPQSKKKFYHRLRLYYTAGEIVEHFRIGFKS